MMHSTSLALPVPLSLLALFVLSASPTRGLAFPSPDTGTTITLSRKAVQRRDSSDVASWLQSHRTAVEAKYGLQNPVSKRAGSGLNLLTNQNADFTYFGSIAVGTPLQDFNVILDTGSSDLWLASASGRTTSRDITIFDTTSSSTFSTTNTPFSVLYASGSASGVLGSDVVAFAGFEVQSQTFGSVGETSSGLLTTPVSGLMGLAFASIASSGATPFWQNIVNTKGALTNPLFAVQLTRFSNVSSSGSGSQLEPGGTFTLGATNASLYTGDIDYQNIPDGAPGYWMQELTGLSVQGQSVTLPGGSGSWAAIDTGTTGIAGPSDILAELYSHIPGASKGTGQFDGYYIYPCDTDVNVAMKFGSSQFSWSISPTDFKFQQVDQNNCAGAIFEISDSRNTNGPSWIIGDTFLKNVYAVFRASPASVGFANLSSTALAQNGATGSPPSPTIASTAPSATGSGSGALSSRMPGQSEVFALVIGLFATLVMLVA